MMEKDQDNLKEPMIEGSYGELSTDLEEEKGDFSDEALDEHPGSELDNSTCNQSNTPSLPTPSPKHTP